MGLKGILILGLITYILFTPLSVDAATPTSSPSAEVKSKLKALQEDIASRAARIKAEISQKLQNKAYLGLVKSKSDNSLTLATKSGSKIVSVNQDTEYISTIKSTSKAKFSLKTIIDDDYLVALGDIDETAVLTAKRIIKITPPEDQKIKRIWGEITSLGSNQLTLKLKNDSIETVTFNSATEFSLGEINASLNDVKVTKPVVVIGEESDSKTLKARFIYIFPSDPNVTPKVASPSASPTASPSAKPKKS